MTSPGERRARAPLSRLARIARFLAPYRLRLACALIALTLAAGSVLAVGQGLRWVIDRGFGSGNPDFLDHTLVGLLGVVVVLAVATYTRFYLVSWVGERVTADIRRAVFDHLLELSPGWFETARTGEVVARLTNDTTLLETVVGSSLSLALRNFLLMIGGLVLLAITSPKLTLLVLLGVPAVVAPILLFGRRVRRLSRASQDRVGEVGAYVDEALHEIRTVQAYGHEARDRIEFGRRVDAAFGAAVRRIRQRAALTAIVITLVFGAIGIILWVGGHDVMAGKLSAGDLSAFVFYSVLVAGAVGAISEVIGDLQRAAGATERLLELLDTRPDVAAPEAPVELAFPVKGEIRFQDVRFAYPSRPEAAALSGLSLQLSPGETLALVGPSGAGKTTVFQLLLRFYDPQLGAVTLDGIDLRRLDPLAVRRQIALVPQDPVIFAADVWENVRYGRPEASEDDVLAACRAAYAAEFIDRLPQGMGSFLGERGVRLSGGQRQRIAIARAILSNRPVLLLDEATSALDAESERMVQLALESLVRGRTTIIIAHRLATVQNADRIAVLDGGRLVAVGTHDALMRVDGLYRRLARMQFAPGGPGNGDRADA